MLIILDWDGTLLDSAGKIIRCMQQAAEDLTLPTLSDAEVKQIIGLGLPEAIAELYPQASALQHEQFRERYVAHFLEQDKQPCVFFPTVLETLQTLKEAGYYLAVATGKSRRGLNRVLANLAMENFFHASRCADETRSKPHPAMLHELLQEFDLPSEQAVMVGDTTYDLQMARDANMPYVGVHYGVHDVASLQALQPLAMLEQFADLLPVVRKLW